MTQVYDPRTIEAAAKVAEEYPSSEWADIPIIRGIAKAIRSLPVSGEPSPLSEQSGAIGRVQVGPDDPLYKALRPSKETIAAIEENCDWPKGARFSFLDSPGAHDPCFVVMPGGASLPVNHHAGEGVDIARAKFIINACNAALSLPVSSVPTPSDAIGETVEKLREALAALEASASQVSRYGAQTGPQWPTLTAALIKARAALATPLPMKED